LSRGKQNAFAYAYFIDGWACGKGAGSAIRAFQYSVGDGYAWSNQSASQICGVVIAGNRKLCIGVPREEQAQDAKHPAQ
jgi:hypothetical protein